MIPQIIYKLIKWIIIAVIIIIFLRKLMDALKKPEEYEDEESDFK